MKAILNKLYKHERLSKSEATQVLKDIASEQYNAAHLASFMTVFMMRPITADELSGFRNALKELSIKVDLSDYNTIDIVGTGGDGKNTFNISTLTSFTFKSEKINLEIASTCMLAHVKRRLDQRPDVKGIRPGTFEII